MLRKIVLCFFLLCLLAGIGAAAFLTWGYLYVTRDLPQFDTVADYRPKAASSIFASDGTLVAEFYDQRRYPVKLNEIPAVVRNAFLAAEDASFYQHPGVDITSIFRAMIKNLENHAARQGGSTITQQVVKNLLLSREKTLTRKVKEAILSYKLENKLTKDEILEIYLNQIFLGNSAYGVKAAALAYFHKSLDQLTLAEAAMIAGLPAAPSGYSPVSHLELAKKRQHYVLDQMQKEGFATPKAVQEALHEELKVYPASPQNIFAAPYFMTEVRKTFAEQFPEASLETDGLKVYTSLDLDADRFATAGLQRGLREVDKRRGWRGPLKYYPKADSAIFQREYPTPLELESGVVYPALVREVQDAKGIAQIEVGQTTAQIDLKEANWAKKRLDAQDHVTWIHPQEVIRPGDVIEVSLQSEPASDATTDATKESAKKPSASPKIVLDQTPDIEGSLVLLDPHSGKVHALIGGYSYAHSQYNRATQALRQPGSTFKPIVYLAAIDHYHYTPATIVYDTPRTFRVGDEFWTPGNFDKKYMGGITVRTALEKSRNLVSADIISRIGIDAAIAYARKLGITSPLGHNLSLALGSSEVTLLELARAYGVFAARGVLFDSVFITKVVDRDGKVLYDYENEKLSHAHQVISENSAFIMASLMKGVVQNGTGYKVRVLNRPIAAKTGTSNDQMDAWFIGYTPQWVCGVWSGFDQKKTIGEKETGGVVSAPIWLYTMKNFIELQEKKEMERLVEESKAEADRLGIEYVPPEPIKPLDFAVPDGVEPFWIDKQTGVLTSPEAPGAIYEYFIRGTEPARSTSESATTNSYLESPEL